MNEKSRDNKVRFEKKPDYDASADGMSRFKAYKYPRNSPVFIAWIKGWYDGQEEQWGKRWEFPLEISKEEWEAYCGGYKAGKKAIVF